MSFLRRLNFNFRYFRKTPWDSGISPPELLEFISQHKAGRAIDLGCGTGTNVITLAQRGWQVTGVDFAPRAINIAKRKIQNAKVKAKVQVGDVTQLKDIHGPFDFALDLGCFHGLSDVEKGAYLNTLTRRLAPSGFWLMYGVLRPAPSQSTFGLTEKDLEQIQTRFRLVSRSDGFNLKRDQPSAYFLFQIM